MCELETDVALRELVRDAAQSLARLDADRLEELALSCEELNRDLVPGRVEIPVRDPLGMERDMAALARVLEATRSNLAVMNRLRKLHARRTEYLAGGDAELKSAEVPDGHH